MSYVQKVLMPKETIEYQAQVSFWAFLPRILLGVILLWLFTSTKYLYGLTILPPLIWLGVFLEYISTQLVITNQRVIAKFGFIRRSTIELSLSKLESISFEQGVLGRIFNFGSIVVSGMGASQTPIPFISKPMDFRKEVLTAQEKLQTA